VPIGWEDILSGPVDVKRKLIPVVAFDEPEIGRPEAHQGVLSFSHYRQRAGP